jgi:hypothetical protein
MRQVLLLTQVEAAAWLSNPPVSERAWQYWEAGKRPVPGDVAQALRAACAQRATSIAEATQALEAASRALREGEDAQNAPRPAAKVFMPSQRPVGVWYAKADDWKWTLRPHGLGWKLHNSVVAHLASAGLIHIVGFDESAYASWSKNLPGITAAGEIHRHIEWAMSVLGSEGSR